jgi:hypothetical protein
LNLRPKKKGGGFFCFNPIFLKKIQENEKMKIRKKKGKKINKSSVLL